MSLADLRSLLPASASKPATPPSVGSTAPTLQSIDFRARLHLVAFVRHCGCPFAEKEVRTLAEVHKQYREVGIVIVSHAQEAVLQDWFDRICKPHFDSLDHIELVSDPDLKYFNSFGIGQLGWTKLVNLNEVLPAIRTLANEGIANTETGEGSNRWLTSGGFAIDKEGIVRYVKIAEASSDIVPYLEAVKTIL